jgi:hypothetical protein
MEINIGVKNKKLLKIRSTMDKYINYFREAQGAEPQSIRLGHGTYADLSSVFGDDMTFRGIKICH